MKIQPDLKTFIEKSAHGNLIPVYGEILADMETPVSAFKKLADGEFAFLLESVEHGERIGRYSFIGCDPPVIIRSRGSEVMVMHGQDEKDRRDCPNVLHYLRDYMSRYKPVVDPGLPPFIGGAVGYLAYDLVRSFEKLPENNPDDLRIPDCFMMIADSVVAFDHVRRRILIIHNAHVEDSPEAAYKDALHKIEILAQRLKSPFVGHAELPPVETPVPRDCKTPAGSNMTPEEYKAGVERIREYIHAGDAFQVVFSQRFCRPYSGDPFDVYRALRAINPSPYMFYLKLGDLKLAGSSPEVLVTVVDREVRVRPIAGTRRRGLSKEEDTALEKELLADPKERAEHIMLVDLGRNDCGRVSKLGSIKVSDVMTIERYSHVIHIVSNVTGELLADCDSFDAVQATLPAGTLSGAPKIRAMEIIDELENVRRGPYGGASGYFGFNGNADFCITIRTAVLKDNLAYVQAGAGIVADSDPDAEFTETVNKAKAMMAAIDMAEAGLD